MSNIKKLNRPAFRPGLARPVNQFNAPAFSRPSFRPGLNGAMSSKNIPKVKRPTRTRRGNEPLGMRTQSFAGDSPIPRQAPDYLRLSQIQAQKEGIMVQLGPSTIKSLVEIKVPDPNNPGLFLEKSLSVGQLLQTQEGILAGINGILGKYAIDTANGRTINQLQLSKLGTLLEKLLSSTGGKKMTKKVATAAIAATKVTPNFELADAGINDNRVTKEKLGAGRMGFLTSWLITPENIPFADVHLTPAFPVYGYKGEPISLEDYDEAMKNGAILDIRDRTLLEPVRTYSEDTGFDPDADEDEDDEEKKEIAPTSRERGRSRRRPRHRDLPKPKAITPHTSDRRNPHLIAPLAETDIEKKARLKRAQQFRADHDMKAVYAINRATSSPPKKSRTVAEAKKQAKQYRADRPPEFGRKKKFRGKKSKK